MANDAAGQSNHTLLASQLLARLNALTTIAFTPAVTMASTLVVSAQVSVSYTSAVLVVGNGAGGPSLQVDGAAGSARFIRFATNSSRRWQVLGANATAESGSDAGSDFSISAYNDSGTLIDSPISIARATGGLITLVRPVSITGALITSGDIGATNNFKHASSDTASVNLAGSTALSGTYALITVYGKSHASQANRIFYDGARHAWRSAGGVTDWLVADGTNITASLAVILPAATTSIPSIRLPHGAAPTSPTNGDMWTTTAGLFVRINGATVGPLS